MFLHVLHEGKGEYKQFASFHMLWIWHGFLYDREGAFTASKAMKLDCKILRENCDNLNVQLCLCLYCSDELIIKFAKSDKKKNLMKERSCTVGVCTKYLVLLNKVIPITPKQSQNKTCKKPFPYRKWKYSHSLSMECYIALLIGNDKFTAWKEVCTFKVLDKSV